jgi:hypothetical protein
VYYVVILFYGGDVDPFVFGVVVGTIGLADEDGDVVGGEETAVGGAMTVGDFRGATVLANDIEECFYEWVLKVDVGHRFEELYFERNVFR